VSGAVRRIFWKGRGRPAAEDTGRAAIKGTTGCPRTRCVQKISDPPNPSDPTMHNGLRLHHELLLLALHDEKGTIAFGRMLSIGLGGALLGELLLEGRVELRPEGRKGRPLVTVVSRATFGDPVLDEGLRKLVDAKRRGNPQSTVGSLSRIKDLRNRTAVALCRQGILRENEESVLLIFKRRVFPTLDAGPERELITRIREAIEEPDAVVAPRTALLVQLARSTGVLRALYSAKELKARKARLEAIKPEAGAGAEATEAAIEAAEAAMVAVMAATTAATTAATASG